MNRVLYKISNAIDSIFVDKVLVDGTGASVRVFNGVLRTFQNGKVQFYIMMVIFVLGTYIFSLK